MMTQSNQLRLAQSVSAIGAGILGFGLGARFGNLIGNYFYFIIIAGAGLHTWGIYIMQMKGSRKDRIAKWLWISAWICLIVLIGLLIYLYLVKQ